MEIKTMMVNQKPVICPQCGFDKISNLLYGIQEIDEVLQKDIDDKRVLIGGCSILKTSLLWFCTSCETEFYLEENKSEIKKEKIYE